jgi:hypothetical protein
MKDDILAAGNVHVGKLQERLGCLRVHRLTIAFSRDIIEHHASNE